MRLQLARENFDEFAELALVDESSGQEIEQQWFHEDWTRLREKHDRLIVVSAVGLGKSQQFTIGYVVWLLGRNPRLRIAIVSKTQLMARQFSDAAAKLIESNPRVRAVFPHLRPGDKWSTELRYVERPEGITGPSIRPIGVGTAIMGSRFDVVIMDDVHDPENSRIKTQRDRVYDWIEKALMNRLEPSGSKVYIVCNAWHPDDVNERLSRRGWPTYRYPLVVTDDLIKHQPRVVRPKSEGGMGLQRGETIWPGRWPQRVCNDLKRNELPGEFGRARLCISRDDGDARFKREWIDAALERGEILPVVDSLADFLAWDDPSYEGPDSLELDLSVPETDDFWIVHGVDLATGVGRDLTAIATIAVDRETHKRFLLRVHSGNWQAPEIQESIIDAHARFGGVFMVENNGQQVFIKQMLAKATAIPIYPYTTGWQKADPKRGIELVAQELYQGKWVIPSKVVVSAEGVSSWVGATEDIEHLCEDWVGYSPNPQAHTGDRAMALWFAQVIAVRMERRAARGR